MEKKKSPRPPVVRADWEKATIRKAIELLMKNEGLPEPAAHRKVQKAAMDQREAMTTVALRYIEFGQLSSTPRR